MRAALVFMLRWALSPLGTLFYAGALAATLLIAGADVHEVTFWLPVVLFLAVSGASDIGAYAVQRRKGLTSAQVADAVFERLWPSRGDGSAS